MTISKEHNLSRRPYVAKDYVKRGLVGMWDGIENVDWETHDSNATTWKDLVGENDVALTSPAMFGKNYMQSAYRCAPMRTLYKNGEIGTLEVVLQQISGSRIWGFMTDKSFGINIQNSSYHTGNLGNTNNVLINCNVTAVNHIAFTKVGWQTVDSYLNGKLYSGTTTYENYGWIGNGFGGSENSGSVTKFFCARLYNVQLTKEEIARNYRIDKERFGI